MWAPYDIRPPAFTASLKYHSRQPVHYRQFNQVMKMRIEYRAGLVTSLARPEGNITGNTFLGPELGPLQLLERGRPPNKPRRSASASWCV